MNKKSEMPVIAKFCLAVLMPGLLGCPIGCLSTLLISIITISLGFCLKPFNTAFIGGIIIWILIFITAIIVFCLGKRVPWRLFIIEIIMVTFLLVSYFAWDTPKYVFTLIFEQDPPESVEILKATYYEEPIDPSAWIHFTANSSDISKLIASNDFGLISNQGPTKIAPDWLQTKNFDNYLKYQIEVPHSHNTNTTDCLRGIWVNQYTNEAYGYYIDL